ncbi:MAG: hypothetical protein ACUVRZ_02110 [Desulfobacca sp.]|uniref:hypothetical protein n=1 Tax=Desulfobacca sp. TaxID=2067990 RepID=UPI0040495689
MGKIKSVVFLLLGAILAIFLYENWVPAPVIKIFGKEIGTLSNSLIIISCFLLGFLSGSLVCLAWSRRQARLTVASGASQQAPETHKAQQHDEEKKGQE